MAAPRIPGKLLPHQVTVERYLGSGGYGDVYADPEHITRALVEDGTKLVRNPGGSEVVSSATIYLEPPETPIKPGSLVTRWAGTAYEVTSKVITSSLLSHPRGLSHVILAVE